MCVVRRSQWINALFIFSAVLTSSGQSNPKPAMPGATLARLEGSEAKPVSSGEGGRPTSPASPASGAISDGDTLPTSVFDAVTGTFKPITTSVEVHAVEQELETSSPAPFQAGGQDVLTLAGSWGDISRYLQILPGVVATSDLSNQILVRGGHPMENLFLVDGIEVPNINHLANANTTGGLGPMIDAAAIQNIKFYTGGYDAMFPERLSSITEFNTLSSERIDHHLEFDLGIQGVGGLLQRNVRRGNLLVSAHHGLINLVGNDVGLNGVPSYTNELTRYRTTRSEENTFTILNVAGWDSIDIVPCASDWVETNTIESGYRGWRETTGIEWQHVHSRNSFGVLDVSDSEQVENLQQNDQYPNPLNAHIVRHACPIPKGVMNTLPVYQEDTNNAFSSARYRYEWATSRLGWSSGTSIWIQRPNLNVLQPVGAFSPYSIIPTRADSTSFSSNFATGETGTYSQLVARPWKPVSLSAGGRLQTLAFGGHVGLTPRLNASYRLGERASVHAAYASYSQLPPYAYLLAYPANRLMSPMQVTHSIIGSDFNGIPSSQVRLEAYNKSYTHIPASSEYPSITIHTMVDMLGQEIVWLPMNSGGHGNASGIELSDITRLGSRLQTQGSVAYSRAKFAGTDDTIKPSNYDYPWVVNWAGVAHVGHGMIASARYGYATGRPYTPYNMKESVLQNRPIYDLTHVNALRAPYYSRLDVLLNKEFMMHRNRMEIYGGIDNVLNRENFLSYAWMTLERKNATLSQTPIFPNFGIRLIVK